ncbi:penicillin-binding protein 2 [bacterium]|nr:penicillin-binding protein 2 [bacterium]
MFEVGRDLLKNGLIRRAADTVPHQRLRFIYSLFALAFAVFIGKTLYLGIQGTDQSRRGTGDAVWTASRADIVDRNGDILAKNVMSGHITLRPGLVTDRDAAARLIHDTLPMEYSLKDALRLVAEKRRFIYVKKLATDAERAAVRRAHIAGLDVEEVQARRYPKRRLFSHIVGFVGQDGHGLEGAERVWDDYLRENTDPLRLSLDARIQSVFYEQLTHAMQTYQAKGAMGLLMDARTGEMIAMVSLPDFDPENLGASSAAARRFAPMRDLFEMGSIFKIFNTALAMENGIRREYPVASPYKILDKFGRTAAKISDVRSFKPPRPELSVEEIMLHSCNVGSAQIALDLPDGAQREFLHRIHMDDRLDLEFGRTERALPPAKWGPVERAVLSFGHGISVTPMHLLLGVNAMTNGGIYIYPTWLRRRVGAVRGERVITPEISTALRSVMVRIAEETSGKKARVSGIEIGGKTATAEKRNPDGTVDRKRNLTAFAGIFPASAPQYTILVFLDEPQGTPESFGLRTAAWNAVPTTGKILDSILPLLFE